MTTQPKSVPAPSKVPPVAIAKTLGAIVNVLDRAKRAVLPPQLRICALTDAALLYQALYTATSLGIPDRLADGPRTVDDLAGSCDADSASLYRVLRALASIGVFEELPDRRFKLTPTANVLRDGIEGSMRDFVLTTAGPTYWQALGKMRESTVSGTSGFVLAHGMGMFEYDGHHIPEGEVFSGAMTNLASQMAAAIIAAYDFTDVRRLMDVGGGHGHLVRAVLRAHPHMRATVFDLPQVIGTTRARLQDTDIASRCEVVEGDFFRAIPAGADAYLMRSILHDWSDEQCVRILKNCRAAMQPDSRLLLVECVVEPGNDPCFGKVSDIGMLVLTEGGRERLEAEFRDLLTRSGFDRMRLIPTAGPQFVIEARPA